ncbi:hypothetical protein V6N13_056236 [Hibiscus sabdariffa]
MEGVGCISSSLIKASAQNGENGRKGLRLLLLGPIQKGLRLLLLGPIQKGLRLLFPKPSNAFVDRLKASLSRTLSHFPPLAGRLATTKLDHQTVSFSIDCNNAGALFIHAKADGVTELADGVVLGCTINHSVVDGTSFWHFINSWSEISRGLIQLSKPPIFQRSIFDNIDYPIRIPRALLEQIHDEDKLIQAPLRERVFHFPKQSIAKLKEKANAEAGTNNISSLQALTSHLWRCIIRNKKIISEEEMTYYVVLGLGVLDCKSEADDKCVVSSNLSSPRFDVYGNDYGWGRPIAVRSGLGNKVDGKLTVFCGAEEGSIDVEACLLLETLEAMANDDEFMNSVTI